MHGVGDLVPSADGSWMVRPPERCANGHRLRGRCIVGTTPCSCQDRHLSWTCDLCGNTTYGPALGPHLFRAERTGSGASLLMSK
jgi:hypothetical protein